VAGTSTRAQWKFVSMVSGALCVIGLGHGTPQMRLLCAGSWGSQA